MNKTLKKMMVLTLACATLCGPALAAPRGGRGNGPRPAPRHQTAKRPPAVKHRAPAKQVHRRPPPPPRHHNIHHRGGRNEGWVTLGAAVVGGLVGGILGAFN